MKSVKKRFLGLIVALALCISAVSFNIVAEENLNNDVQVDGTSEEITDTDAKLVSTYDQIASALADSNVSTITLTGDITYSGVYNH